MDREVKLGYLLAIDFYATSLQSRLDFRAALFKVGKEPLEQRIIFLRHILGIIVLLVIIVYHLFAFEPLMSQYSVRL